MLIQASEESSCEETFSIKIKIKNKRIQFEQDIYDLNDSWMNGWMQCITT